VISLDFDASALFAPLLILAQILVVNLLLSADNALVIAMASRGLPPADVRRASFFGAAGAIGLRIAMGGVALYLMRIPFLRILAALALLVIAVRLTLQRDDAETRAALTRSDQDGSSAGRSDLLAAVWAIIVADVAMSLDNVVAIAAIAQDNFYALALGLGLSIPMLIWGSALIRQILDENGYLVILSGAFLGWIAGAIAMSDPIIGTSIVTAAPFLPIATQVACAIFVLWQSLILAPPKESRGTLHAN
jgi:YjbE family integral membrane protein